MKNLTLPKACGVLAAMEDKRLTTRLSVYWNQLRGDQPLPPWKKFNVGSLQDIWGQCCVWRVDVANHEKKVNQYTYEYIGSRTKEALGEDLTGSAFISAKQRFPGARIVERISEVVNGLAPINDDGTFVNDKNQVVKFRSCLLPFGRGDKVTHIVLGLSWKAF